MTLGQTLCEEMESADVLNIFFRAFVYPIWDNCYTTMHVIVFLVPFVCRLYTKWVG